MRSAIFPGDGGPMTSTERHALLRRLLATGGRLTVDDVKLHFDVSSSTARRDLDVMARSADVRRVHGGVLLATRSLPPSGRARWGEVDPAIERLASQAADRISGYETVLLDGSRAAVAVGRQIALRGLSVGVVTNSLAVVATLHGIPRPDGDVMLLGGRMREDWAFAGAACVRAVGRIFAHRAIVGAAGVTARGELVGFDAESAEIAAQMIEQAESALALVHGAARSPHAIAHGAHVEVLSDATVSSLPMRSDVAADANG